MDGTQLAHEILYLPDMLLKIMTQLGLLQFIHEKELDEIYPNRHLSELVSSSRFTEASAVRSLSNLKPKAHQNLCQVNYVAGTVKVVNLVGTGVFTKITLTRKYSRYNKNICHVYSLVNVLVFRPIPSTQ